MVNRGAVRTNPKGMCSGASRDRAMPSLPSRPSNPRRWMRFTAAVATLLAAAAPWEVEAQLSLQIIEIEDVPACQSCSIDLEVVATLTPPAEQIGFTQLPPVSLARDHQGRFYAGPMVGDAIIGVFEADGTYLRGYGRSGQGPHEFTSSSPSMLIRVVRDELWIFEGPYLHRLQLGTLEARDKRMIRMAPHDAVVLGSTLLVQWPIREVGGSGTPIQVLDEDGAILKGIGVTSARPMSLSSPYDAFRRLARARNGDAVWSAYVNRYEISRFDLEGREELRIRRQAEWFEEYEDELPGEMFSVPSRPRVESLFEDSDGLLWVAISHGSSRMSSRRPLPAAGEQPVPSDFDFNYFLDTTIEVLDLASGRVLARHVFDGYIRGVATEAGQVLFFSLREGPELDLVVDVFAGRISGAG